MAGASFAARRRRARSSSVFQLVLGSSLVLLFVLVAWSANNNQRGPSADHKRNVDGGIVHLDTMTQHHIDDIDPDASLDMDISGQMAMMPLRIISYNIRYATKEPVGGERPWGVRCPKLCTQLRFITAGHESPFVCLQEALHSQVLDVQSHLGASWSHIGRGRGQGERDGEFSPIFYRSDIWRCDHNETRWLSRTPNIPSRGWDAALNRIVTMGRFTHKRTGTCVIVMSTHFDHLGKKARKHSAELLITFAEQWHRQSHTRPSAVLIGGDFNSTPDDDAYQVMTAPGSGMSDVSTLVPVDRQYGNHLTYTSFGEPGEHPQRIDFIFIKEPRTAAITTSGVLANSFDDHIQLSDHRAVVADLEIAR